MVPGPPPQPRAPSGAPRAGVAHREPGLSAPLLLAAGPLLLVAAGLTLRAPRRALLCAYAAVVPFGSGITLPVPFPPPFDTITSLLGVAALAALAIGLATPEGQARRLPVTAAVAMLLLAAHGATLAWSVDRAASADAILVLGSLVGLYLVAALARFDEDDVDRLGDAIVLGGALACLYGFVLLLTGGLPQEGAGLPRFATAGGVGDNSDPNITAATLLLPLVIAAGRALDAGGARRWLHGAAAGLLVLGILLTASRGGVVGALVALLLVVAHQRRPAVGLGGLVGAGVLLYLVASLLAPAQLDRLGQEGSSGRTNVWELGIAACQEWCPTGSGIGTYLQVHQQAYFQEPSAEGFRASLKAHNIWLQAAVETGILGVGLLLALFAATLAELRRLPRSRRGPPLAAVVGLLVTNSFLGNLGFKYFWLVLLYAAVTSVAEPRPAERRADPAAVAIAAARREPVALVLGATLGAAILAIVAPAPAPPSFEATATVVATRSPEFTEAGVDEVVEAVFEASPAADLARLEAPRDAVAFRLTARERDRRDAATDANLAAAALVEAFNARPAAFTTLAVADRARADLAVRLGGGGGLARATPPAAGAIAGGMTAGLAAAHARRRRLDRVAATV